MFGDAQTTPMLGAVHYFMLFPLVSCRSPRAAPRVPSSLLQHSEPESRTRETLEKFSYKTLEDGAGILARAQTYQSFDKVEAWIAEGGRWFSLFLFPPPWMDCLRVLRYENREGTSRRHRPQGLFNKQKESFLYFKRFLRIS